jgi:hypothetical protein
MDLRSNTNDLKNKRFFKVKKPSRHFICALCSAPRQMKYKKNLNEKNYIQITVLAVFLAWAFYPIMGIKSLSLVFILWPIFEVANKILYRKEIPCPYCGFDATWYRRDVKIAKQKVEEFWSEKLPAKLDNEAPEVVAPSQEENYSEDLEFSNQVE